MIPALQWVDENILDLAPSGHALLAAHQQGNAEQMTDAALRHLNGHSYLYYTGLNLLRNASIAFMACKENAPQTLNVLHTSTAIIGVTTGLGLITYTLTAVQESLGIARHVRLYNLFHSENYSHNPLSLADDLEALSTKYKDSELATRLRPWFIEKHQLNKAHLKRLSEEIRRGDVNAIRIGTALAGEIQALAIKKTVAHIFGLISMIFAFGGIAISFVACPLFVSLLIIGASSSAWVARTVMFSGWVDNPKPGFSAARCLPKFIVSRYFATAAEKDLSEKQRIIQRKPLSRVSKTLPCRRHDRDFRFKLSMV